MDKNDLFVVIFTVLVVIAVGLSVVMAVLK